MSPFLCPPDEEIEGLRERFSRDGEGQRGWGCKGLRK